MKYRQFKVFLATSMACTLLHAAPSEIKAGSDQSLLSNQAKSPQRIDAKSILKNQNQATRFYQVKEGQSLKDIYNSLGIHSPQLIDQLSAQTANLNPWIQRNPNWTLIKGLYIKLAVPKQAMAKSPLKNDLQNGKYRLALIESDGNVDYYRYSIPAENLDVNQSNGQIQIANLNSKTIEKNKLLNKNQVTQAYLVNTARVENRFFVRGFFSGRINNVQTNAPGSDTTINTNPGLFTQVDIGMNMTEKLALVAFARGSYLTASPPTGGNLTGTVQTSPGLGVSAEYKHNSRVRFSTFAAYEQEPFVRGTSLSDLQLDDVYRARIGFVPTFQLWRKDSQRLEFETGPIYQFSRTTNSIDVESNLLIDAKIRYQIDLDQGNSLAATLQWIDQTQTTNISTNEFSQVGFGLQYIWR